MQAGGLALSEREVLDGGGEDFFLLPLSVKEASFTNLTLKLILLSVEYCQLPSTFL